MAGTDSQSDIEVLIQEIKDLTVIVEPDLELLRVKVEELSNMLLYEPVPGFQFKVNLNPDQTIKDYSIFINPSLTDFKQWTTFSKEQILIISDFLENFYD